MDIFYLENIETSTNDNNNFRHVIYTSPNKVQLVLMSIKPGEDIGLEQHTNTDQFIRIEKGTGKSVFGKDKNKLEEKPLNDGSIVLIPANVWHNIINTGTEDLKLYTIYSFAQHEDQLIEATKPLNQDGGERMFYKKYIKYKHKYNNLKNHM